MSHLYILDDDNEPVPCDDVLVWGQWFEQASKDRTRIVKQDYAEEEERVGVSTVFLGVDHKFSLGGPPVLWESLVFGTSLDGTMDRYTSYAEAMRGHEKLVAEVRAAYDAEHKSDKPKPRRKRAHGPQAMILGRRNAPSPTAQAVARQSAGPDRRRRGADLDAAADGRRAGAVALPRSCRRVGEGPAGRLPAVDPGDAQERYAPPEIHGR